MARVLALVPDLMFGSRLQGALAAAGHELELAPSPERLQALLDDPGARAPAALILDLEAAGPDGQPLALSLAARGLPARLPTLGFYPHVDAHARALAERAGVGLAVPRSRMAREAPALLERLLGAREGAP